MGSARRAPMIRLIPRRDRQPPEGSLLGEKLTSVQAPSSESNPPPWWFRGSGRHLRGHVTLLRSPGVPMADAEEFSPHLAIGYVFP